MSQHRLSMLVCSLIVVSGLAGCGGDSSDPGPDPEVDPQHTGGKADASAETLQGELDVCQDAYDGATDNAIDNASFMQASYDFAECARTAIGETVPTIEGFLVDADSSSAGHSAQIIDGLRATLAESCRVALDGSETAEGTLRNGVEADCLAQNELRIAALVQSSLFQAEAPFDFEQHYPVCETNYSAAVEAAMSQQDFLQASFGLADCVEVSLGLSRARLVQSIAANFPGDDEHANTEVASLNSSIDDVDESFCSLAAEVSGGDYDGIGSLVRATCTARIFYVFDQLLAQYALSSGDTEVTGESLQADLDVCRAAYEGALEASEDTSAAIMQASFDLGACSQAAINETIPTVEQSLTDNESEYGGQTFTRIAALRNALGDACRLALDASETSDGTLRNTVEAGCLAENEVRLAAMVQGSLLGGDPDFDFDAHYPACGAAYSAAIDGAMSQQDYLQASYDLAECVELELGATQLALVDGIIFNDPARDGRAAGEVESLMDTYDAASVGFCTLAADASGGGTIGDLFAATCSGRLIYLIDQLFNQYIPAG